MRILALILCSVVCVQAQFLSRRSFYARPAAAAGGGGSPLITSGLILYYKFDEGSGTTATDASGNEHNGTLGGAAAPTYTTAYIGANALNFTGNSKVDSGVNAAANPGSGDFSMVCWFKTSDASTIAMLGKSSGNNYALFLSGGVAFLNLNGANNCTGGSSLANGAWHHIAATIVGGGVTTLYIDGSSVNSSTIGAAISPGGNLIIGDLGEGSFKWNGDIDEACIYSRALSGAEVSQLAGQTHP